MDMIFTRAFIYDDKLHIIGNLYGFSMMAQIMTME